VHFKQYRKIRAKILSTASVVQSSCHEARRKTGLNYKHTYNDLVQQVPKGRSLRPEGRKAGVEFLGSGNDARKICGIDDCGAGRLQTN